MRRPTQPGEPESIALENLITAHRARAALAGPCLPYYLPHITEDEAIMREVPSGEVQKNFGLYREVALNEPVAVQHYGQPNVVMLSMAEYRRLKDLDRQVLRFDDLSDDDLAAIAAEDIPAEFRYDSDRIPEA
jgi:PHD/YefM family antitoxin component YafN of YafNO toxin-antitoxin module